MNPTATCNPSPTTARAFPPHPPRLTKKQTFKTVPGGFPASNEGKAHEKPQLD